MSRERHAVLVRLLDAQQLAAIDSAIEARVRDGDTRSPTAILRAALLDWAGRRDLDRAPQDAAARARLGGFAKERARIEREVGGDLDRKID